MRKTKSRADIAEGLRIVLSMPEYQETLGKWLAEARDDAILSMAEAETDKEFFSSQGKYKVLDHIKQEIDATLHEEVIDLKDKMNKE